MMESYNADSQQPLRRSDDQSQKLLLDGMLCDSSTSQDLEHYLQRLSWDVKFLELDQLTAAFPEDPFSNDWCDGQYSNVSQASPAGRLQGIDEPSTSTFNSALSPRNQVESEELQKSVNHGPGGRDTNPNLFLKTGECSSADETGVHCKTNSGNEFLFDVAVLDENGTEGISVYDSQKKQRYCITHPCVRKSRFNSVSRLRTTKLAECGGFIFVASEQEYGKGKDFCIHRLNLKKFESLYSAGVEDYAAEQTLWEKVMECKRTGVEPDSRVIQPRPDFPGNPASAVLVECGEHVVLFSEQEPDPKRKFIYIHILNQDGSGAGRWEEVKQYKKPRHRAPNWKLPEIDTVLETRLEALGTVGRDLWKKISIKVENRHGIKRSLEQCEDLYGTVLKEFKKILCYLEKKKIQPGSREWTDYWQTSGNETGLLRRVLDLKRYEWMKRIEDGKKSQNIECVQELIGGASSSYDSTNSAGLHRNNPSMIVNDTVKFYNEIKARRDMTQENIIEMMREYNKTLELQLEFEKLAGRRPRKLRKRST